VKNSMRLRLRSTAWVAVGLASVLFASFDAEAQQRKKVVYTVPAENTKYIQQHVMDVGDMPGHQLRIYEIQRTFPKDGPVFEGVRLVESWSRGYSNYIDQSGPSTVYTVYVLENGDKFFGRIDLVSQATSTNADGSKKSMATIAGTISGGTGKFVGIRGTVRSVVNSDIKAGVNAAQNEIEYWMEK
jgi:hypothetical protein